MRSDFSQEPLATTRFIVLLAKRGDSVWLLGQDAKRYRVRITSLSAQLCQSFEAAFANYTSGYLASGDFATKTKEQLQTSLTREILLQEGLGATPLLSGWLLRPAPNAGMWVQARHERLHIPFSLTIVTFLISQILILSSWSILGLGVQGSHFERAWLWAWALLNLTALVLQMITNTNQNLFFVKAGGIFKRQLLYGTSQLNPTDIRHQGAGQFLGRVMESETLEGLAIHGSLAGVVGGFMLLINGIVLGFGAGGWIHSLLLALWSGLAFLIAWRYFVVGTRWVTAYREMTNELVEQMVGHRTRLVQEDPEQWHDAEDQSLARYVQLSAAVDSISTLLNHLVPRGWLIVGILGIAYPLATASGEPGKLLISIGGILFAYQAFINFAGVLKAFIDALMAWNQVDPLLKAAARQREQGTLVLAEPTSVSQPVDAQNAQANVQANVQTSEAGSNLLVARDLFFRYRAHRPPVVNGCNLEIYHGNRMLLEGPSGGGKSTLATVLAGLNHPEAGLLLLRGFDPQTVGREIWRQRILMAPQFQENHTFGASLAFNLFMGHRWPPTPADLAEAAEICQELGLGELIARMPAGFEELLGESGWQLSHGERSRLYIARALLQRADMLILDESFGALDPENMRSAMESVLKRTPTMLVIAHP